MSKLSFWKKSIGRQHAGRSLFCLNDHFFVSKLMRLHRVGHHFAWQQSWCRAAKACRNAPKSNAFVLKMAHEKINTHVLFSVTCCITIKCECRSFPANFRQRQGLFVNTRTTGGHVVKKIPTCERVPSRSAAWPSCSAARSFSPVVVTAPGCVTRPSARG